MRGLEAADQIGGGGCFAQKPLVARLLSLRSDSTPVLEYVVGNDKRFVRPVQVLARAGNLGCPERFSVRFRRPRLRGCPEADRRPAGDHDRPIARERGFERAKHVGDVLAVAGIGFPAGSLEAHASIAGIGKRGRSVDRYVIVVEKNDEFRKA